VVLKANEMGIKGRSFVESKFSWDIVAKDTVKNLE